MVENMIVAQGLGMPVPTLQIITLVVSSIAAVGGICSVVIGSRLASREAKNSWMREEQIRAYEEFTGAAWSGIEEIAGGATQDALDHPDFSGLDQARSAVIGHTSQIYSSLRRIQIVGAEHSVTAANEYAVNWVDVCGLAVPLKGNAHAPAQFQRLDVINFLTNRLMQLTNVMRADLELSTKKQKKKHRAAGGNNQAPKSPRQDFSIVEQGYANRMLREWRVRTWDQQYATIGPSYRKDDQPWKRLKIQHDVLQQHLVATMRKPKGEAWFLAIDGSLTDFHVDLIERDAASIVVSNGYSPITRYGGHAWISGESDGEQIYWWTQAELVLATS